MLWGRYASNAREARYPQLWQGRLLGLCPSVQAPSGANLYDLQGSTRHGVATNATIATSWERSGGKYAFRLAGNSTNGVAIGYDPSLVSTSIRNWTMAAWVYRDGSTYSSFPTAISYGRWFATLGMENASKKIQCWRNNRSSYYSTSVIPDATWTHIACVNSYQNSTQDTLQIFFNGILETTATGVTAVSSSPGFSVGNVSPLLSSGSWSGLLDDINVWGRSLSQSEILLLAKLPRGAIYQSRRDILWGSTDNRRRRILCGGYN